MAEGKGGCLTAIIGIVIVSGIVGSCNSLLGNHYDADYISSAHEAVQAKLKSPSTADFCGNDIVNDSPATDANDGDKIVMGCVNAQNGFGAIVEVDYVVSESKDTKVLDVAAKEKN